MPPEKINKKGLRGKAQSYPAKNVDMMDVTLSFCLRDQLSPCTFGTQFNEFLQSSVKSQSSSHRDT